MVKRLINYCINILTIVIAVMSIATVYVNIDTLMGIINNICVQIAYGYNSFIEFMNWLDKNIYIHAFVTAIVVILLPILLFGCIVSLILHLND